MAALFALLLVACEPVAAAANGHAAAAAAATANVAAEPRAAATAATTAMTPMMAPLRASRGLGRDTPCIEPPPPLRGDLSARRASPQAPSHLKYLGLDGEPGAAEQASWTNLGQPRWAVLNSVEADAGTPHKVIVHFILRTPYQSARKCNKWRLNDSTAHG